MKWTPVDNDDVIDVRDTSKCITYGGLLYCAQGATVCVGIDRETLRCYTPGVPDATFWQDRFPCGGGIDNCYAEGDGPILPPTVIPIGPPIVIDPAPSQVLALIAPEIYESRRGFWVKFGFGALMFAAGAGAHAYMHRRRR